MKDSPDFFEWAFYFSRKSRIALLLVAFFGLSLTTITHGQDINIGGVINAYTPVTGINANCFNVIEVEDPSPFTSGDRVLLIQMSGAEIDVTNGPSFGEITDIGSAGLYEFGTIISIIPVSNEIILENQLLNGYDLNGKVQLVLVPQYENATVTSLLFAPQWDGETGGVLALEVAGILSMDAPINCTGRGFQGGSASQNFYQAGFCASQNYFFQSNPERGGEKQDRASISNSCRKLCFAQHRDKDHIHEIDNKDRHQANAGRKRHHGDVPQQATL